MTRSMPLPEDIEPGGYQVVMGIYEFPSIERLPIVERRSGETLPDALIPVAEVTIER